MAERIESDMEVSFEAIEETRVVSPLLETLMQKSKLRQDYVEKHYDTVDILEEGLKLRLDLQNLKKEFQHILEGQSCYLKSEIVEEVNITAKTDASEKQRRDMVLVSSDFNAGRVKSDPTGLVVSDKPSSQQGTTTPSRRGHARSVYRNHKRRLMARRESGDGAALDGKNAGHTQSTPSNARMVSPMRRIPIKEKLSELGSPFGLMPRQDLPKAMTSPFHAVRDYTTVARPSPEGLVASHGRRNSNTVVNKYPLSVPQLVHSNHSLIPQSQHSNCQESKPANKKRCKKQFPKTPKSAKMATRQLETIGEDEQIRIQKRKKQLFSEDLIFHKPSSTTVYDSSSDIFAKPIKDITDISHISGKNLREQPSSANFREQLQTTFDYPLHSTMNYPLHSTMQNAQKDLNITDSESDISSIVQKLDSSHEKSPKQSRHTKSSSGISLGDSDNVISPKSGNARNHQYVNLPNAKRVNMDIFSCDEGILSNSEESEASFSQSKQHIPVTPVNVVKDYYTLTYTPEELKKEAEESDCNSSYLSFNVDNPTDDHHSAGHFKIPSMVSCRCHVNQVYKIKRQTGFFEHSNGNQQFAESTLSMDSRMRAIHPAELEMMSHHKMQSSSHSKSSDKPASSKVSSSTNSSRHSSTKAANRINADSLLQSESDYYVQGKTMERGCSAAKPVRLADSKRGSTDCVKNSDKVVVKPISGAETNCLNLGKILKVKDGKKEFVENTIINHTLGNQNVTMVAQGCLGFLKRKNKSSSKKKAVKKNQQMEEQFKDEDKENFRSRYQTKSRSRIQSRGVSCNIVEKSYNPSEDSHCGSMVSNMDHELKRKISKRMKEFRETTFTDPNRMYYQTMGQL